MPKKIRQIKKLLTKAGYEWRPGKGSHQVWTHPLLEDAIVIARKDGDDAPLYLEKQAEDALNRLEAMQEGDE
jgi:predicted RNA binding protein YcfA (HicA-like mRNA interferase family)